MGIRESGLYQPLLTQYPISVSKCVSNQYPGNLDNSIMEKKQGEMLGVDFSYCWINLEEGWYSLEQYIGFEGRQAFNYYCSLHQVWREAEN